MILYNYALLDDSDPDNLGFFCSVCFCVNAWARLKSGQIEFIYDFRHLCLKASRNLCLGRSTTGILFLVFFFRPTELQKDKLITPSRLCGMVSLALVSWTTCGAFAVLIIYLQYLFKVLKG